MSPIDLSNRREWITRAAAGGAMIAAADQVARANDANTPESSTIEPAPLRDKMKKSINLWAFPYPDKMDLRQCLQLAKDAGFDGIELNFDLESDLSPEASPADFQAIAKMADEIGIAISGLCSFLFWPYPLTSNDPEERARGLELAG
ncbi:MAG: TIM barrel protein, partial [Planctomycetota bacterium]